MGSEVRDATVTLSDGTRIHLLEAGQPGAAPAIVFIPGWTLPAFLWKDQMRRFSSDRLVIAIDPRSQGDSTKTETGNTPEQRARDLREILANRHITSAVLVGWSQGVDRRPALTRIDRPTLVIGSAESALVEAQKRMADAIPGAELLMLKGVGHAVFVDAPDLFAQAMQRLLQREGQQSDKVGRR